MLEPAPETADPSPGEAPAAEPTATSAFDFEQVYKLSRREDPEGDLWMLEMYMFVDEADQDLLNEYDGVVDSLDASHAHIYAPLALGQRVTLVTAEGLQQRSITGFGLYGMMDYDVVTAMLGPVGEDDRSPKGLAIVGALQPAADARLRTIESTPPSAELVASLTASYAAARADLLAGFEPLDGEPSERPRVEGLGVEAGCIRTYAGLALPAPFVALVAVECGKGEVYEARLSALLLVDEAGQPTPLGEYDGWSLDYGASELSAVVDLDGDGVDELLLQDYGYEYYEERWLAWDGSGYAIFPPKRAP